MEKYIEILSSLDPNQKIVFLEKVLLNSKELQSQFVKFFTNNQSNKVCLKINFNDMVLKMAGEYQDILEELDLEEPDYERWHNRSDRYYDEWEIGQEVVQEEVDELFDKFKVDLISQFTQGNLEFGMAKLTGLFKACYEASITDPYENLGDPQKYFIDCIKEMATELEIVISRTIFNTKVVSETIKDTMQCFKIGAANQFSTDIHDLIMAQLLSNNSASCLEVYTECKANVDYIFLFPNTYLFAIRIAKTESWVTEAERLCTLNVGVSKELLEYQSKEDKIAFHKNAKIVFPFFKNELVDLIAKEIDDEYDTDFTKELLMYKIKMQFQIEDYKRLADLLSQNEKIQYIESLKNSCSTNFYIKVLEVEDMGSQILEFAKSPNGLLTDLTSIMRSIISEYPSECFEISKIKIIDYLEKNMGRNYYREVATLLKFHASIQSNTENLKVLIQEICSLYSRRPALKDELKQLGLLKI